MRILLIVLAFAMSTTASAFPTRDTGCSGCHDTADNPGANISPETQSIDLGIGETGFVTFSVTGVPENSKIALFNLDTAGATVGSPDDWFFEAGTYKSGTTDDAVFSTASYDYRLTLTGDVLGTYDIQVLLLGGGGPGAWRDEASLQINVVPIPAAVWLFGSGLLGLVGVARMRRNKT